AVEGLKRTWSALGDSIVVVGGDGLWSCHVHTDDVGGAIEAGIVAGRPERIQVTDLLDQVHHRDVVTPPGAAAAAVAPVVTAVVAVAAGDGVHKLLAGLGVHEVVTGGQSMNPSTAELLAAVDACAADGVVLLPNNGNVVPVARQ